MALVYGESVLGSCPTRLETRTKEFSVCASHWVSKPKGVMKVKETLFLREDGLGTFFKGPASHSRGVSISLREEAHLERTR